MVCNSVLSSLLGHKEEELRDTVGPLPAKDLKTKKKINDRAASKKLDSSILNLSNVVYLGYHQCRSLWPLKL